MLPDVTADQEEPSYLGIGLYSIPEAARLLRTPSRTVRNWAKGYTFSRKGQVRDSRIITPDYPELAAENILTFVDFIEMHVVRMLRTHNVPMQTIKLAAVRLSEKRSTNHPFAVEGIDTDGRHIFHTDEDGVEELGAYQFVMGEVAQQFFKKLEYEDDLAARFWPIGHGKVLIDPKRNFGKPIVYRGGVPTYALYKMRLAGETTSRLANWWEIPEEYVNYAIEYEEYLAA